MVHVGGGATSDGGLTTTDDGSKVGDGALPVGGTAGRMRCEGRAGPWTTRLVAR